MFRLGTLKRLFCIYLAIFIFVLIINIKEYSIKTDSSISALSPDLELKLDNPSHLRHIRSENFTDNKLELKIEENVSDLNKTNKLDSPNVLENVTFSVKDLINKKHITLEELKQKLKDPKKIAMHLRGKEKNTLKFRSKLNDNNQTAVNSDKKDWHDYAAIEDALQRTGLGELGQPAFIKDKNEKVISEILTSMEQYGMNGYISDRISVNRSLPDYRPDECKTRKYDAKLPKVSVIMPFFNECFSTLVRSCHSIINRTPPELLQEILLVNDNSTLDDLGDKLEKYVNEFLPKVKIIKLPERYGLINARLAGAKHAKSEILIFFDSHIEVGYNWLPPLIDPIVLNNKTCTCPYIDTIQFETFRYLPVPGYRGGFDWELYYKRLPLLPAEDYTIPHSNPVMAGGLFAIRADFFWELGGYDTGLELWGGEQYELSFKIWMCGGTLLDVPCSRVAHIYKETSKIRGMSKVKMLKNYMRVAEVWMDDYKNYFYRNFPEQYRNMTFGDISDRKALREKLQCKSFKWFLDKIAFDTVKQYPLTDPIAYAKGRLQSFANPKYCLAMQKNLAIEMTKCVGTGIEPKRTQNWILSENGQIRMKGDTFCLEVLQKKQSKQRGVFAMKCDGLKESQEWIFDDETKWIIHGVTERCLGSFPQKRAVYLSKCDEKKPSLKWNVGFYNQTIFESVINR